MEIYSSNMQLSNIWQEKTISNTLNRLKEHFVNNKIPDNTDLDTAEISLQAKNLLESEVNANNEADNAETTETTETTPDEQTEENTAEPLTSEEPQQQIQTNYTRHRIKPTVEQPADKYDCVNIDDSLAGAWGDPHFNIKDTSGENVTIDHKGEVGKTYNILNADGLNIDAEYKDWNNGMQVMGAIRVSAGKQNLLLNNGKVLLDGNELTAGTVSKLSDNRTIEVQDNGSVKINTIDNLGSINLTHITEESDQYYNVDPTGELKINTSQESGGILGFLTEEGQTKTRDEILAENDTNQDGMLDDGDAGLASKFESKDDIGLY